MFRNQLTVHGHPRLVPGQGHAINRRNHVELPPAVMDPRQHAMNAQTRHLAAMQQPNPAHHRQVFRQPVTIRPEVPVQVTNFVRHQRVPRGEQTRHGGELQTLRRHGQTVGVMTRYPATRQDVAAMLERALETSAPRIVNLMNPGDMGIHRSYVDRMPENKVCRIGHLKVCRQTVGREKMGANGFDGAIGHLRTCLRVYDPSKPDLGWRTVDHHAYPGWKDTTTPPPKTFEHMWKSLHALGHTDQLVVHCAGGVGRTGMMMWRLAFQAYLEQANRQGRHVSEAEAASFLNALTEEARSMRGHQVLPDDDQIRVLYQSCLHAVHRQSVTKRR